MPSYSVLKKLLESKEAEAPTDDVQPIDSEKELANLEDAKAKRRSGTSIQKVLPEEEGLEQPFYMPDELAAGAMAPGISKALPEARIMAMKALRSQAAQDMYAPLANQVGAIGKKIGISNTTMKPSVSKMLNHNPNNPLENMTRDQYEQMVASNVSRTAEQKAALAKTNTPEYQQILAQEKAKAQEEANDHMLNLVKEAEAKKQAQRKAWETSVAERKASYNPPKITELSSEAPNTVTPKLTYNSKYNLDSVLETMQNSLRNGEDWESMLNKLPEMTTKQYNEILTQKPAYLKRLNKN